VALIALAFSLSSVPLAVPILQPRASRSEAPLYRSALHLAAAEPAISAAVEPAVDELVDRALGEGKLPGCVVVVGRHDQLLFHKAYGARALLPERMPMTEDTIFDLASLTKPLATATSIMILAERGALALDEPAARYVPEFGEHGKQRITLRQLLTHVAGLPADTPLEDFDRGKMEALRRIYALTPRNEPGTKFTYSDVGFLVLEEVVRRVSGQQLDEFTRANIWDPLAMPETGFLPPPALRDRAAPTELRRGAFMVGEVHDPRAYRVGGVAGHAGLFSSARDLTRYTQALLQKGTLEGRRVLSAESVRAMFARHDVPGGIRTLGWDSRSAFATQRGDALSRTAVGHGGYTGTSLWLDPARDIFVLFLSNRVHPEGKGAVNALVADITNATVKLLSPSKPASPEPAPGGAPARAPSELGIDVLRRDEFAELRGARVGLITNASGVASDGTSTLELLRRAPALELVAIFAPEHGLQANRDERIGDSVDPSAHLPVYSLYGDTFEPTAAMLQGIDTLVFDIQDVGARFYTYASTLHRVLQAAARRGLRVVVLDRPNPLGGVEVAGPVVTGRLSFVNHARLPVRHGMTLGELADLIDADEHLGTDLEVVSMRGWQRGDEWAATGLRWVAPSPNLHRVRAVELYPAIALVEGTNVSVGRGTDTPFELLGAPFVDAVTWTAQLTALRLPGIRFSEAQFTPRSGTYARETCHGVRIAVTDRATFEPVRTGVAIALELRRRYPEAWHPERLDDLLGNAEVTRAILDLRPLDEIQDLWRADLQAFRVKRDKYLLYR